MDQLRILRKCREDDDPEPLEQYEGKCLITLSRSELIKIAKEKKVNLYLDDLILIGGIKETREILILVSMSIFCIFILILRDLRYFILQLFDFEY